MSRILITIRLAKEIIKKLDRIVKTDEKFNNNRSELIRHFIREGLRKYDRMKNGQ